MSRFSDQKPGLTEVFVVTKSINSLRQIEASVGSMCVALSEPLVENGDVHMSKADARGAKGRLEGFSDAETDDQEDGTCTRMTRRCSFANVDSTHANTGEKNEPH